MNTEESTGQYLPVLYISMDGDDTVWSTDGSRPDGYYQNQETLSELIQRGNEGSSPPIGYCTGREILYIIATTRFITAPDTWSILESGTCFYNLATGERINHPLLTPETEEVFQQIRSMLLQFQHRFVGLKPYTAKELNIALERRFPQVNLDRYIGPVKDFFHEFADFIDITTSSIAIDIMPKGVNKGTAILELSNNLLNIPCQQMLGIGDSRGDFPMLELVGYTGCPSNASQECKDLITRKGGYVSPYPYVIGVVDIIEHYLSITN